jgi:hypothetical protein
MGLMAEAKKRKAGKVGAKVPAVPVELNAHDAASLDELKARHQSRPRRAQSTVKVVNSALRIECHDKEHGEFYYLGTREAVGSSSSGFLHVTLNQVVGSIAGNGAPSEDEYNAAIAVMAAVQPENEVEALLASQMVAANTGAHRCVKKMLATNRVDFMQSYGGLANKFMRTFAVQMEALAKIRRGGEQVVKYIHVHEGGQAVVAGTINQGGGGNSKDAEQSHRAGPACECAALPGPDSTRDGMPLTSHAERAVSHARGPESRGAQG